MQTNVVTTPGRTLTYSRDYAEMLRGMGLEFTVVDEHYLRVGEPKKVQGWILHLSVIKTQVQNLAMLILPLLAERAIPFRIVKDYRSAKDSLDGVLGYHQLGKVITIYYEDDNSLGIFTKTLIDLTKEFRGPAIPTDAHLGSIIYTRYGGINPLVQVDSAGCIGRYIYNAKGKLEMETYHIPFAMPLHVTWPFEEITAPPKMQPNKILYNNYLLTSLLKQDAKGEVYKALRVKRFYPEWCIIKEGRHDMWTDDQGRDIRDRLRWQYRLQKELYGQVSVPEPYAFFEEKEGSYMAMQYVKGKSLSDIAHKIHAGKTWLHLSNDQKLNLIDYLTQIIDQCKILHRQGYVHRDLALSNFIVNKKNKVVMIDLELTYSLREKTPYPPFRLGTPGFMSPEQIKTKTPTDKEDIYALGAMMIELFTSIEPRKYGIHNPVELKDNMAHFIGHEHIAKLIAQCMSNDPQDRPMLSALQKSVEEYREELIKDTRQSAFTLNKRPDTERVRRILEESLNGVCDMILENPIKTRYKDIEWNSTNESTISMGWYAGLSGILWVLGKAGRYTSVNNLKEAYINGLATIDQKLVNERKEMAPSLYTGSAGVTMSIVAGLNNNWISNVTKWKGELLSLLQIPPTRLDIAHGAAGQGLAVLNSLSHLPKNAGTELLKQYTELLLNAQQEDGSWMMDEHKELKSTGFSLGNTGIIFFLLEYYHLFPNDTRIHQAIINGLRWTTEPAKTAGNYKWLTKNNHKIISLGIDGDIAGIVLCFIRAYTILKEPVYRVIAEELLRNIPKNLVNNDLSTAMGLTGLGEVYLEATNAFKSDEWENQINWIINLILNASHSESPDNRYWMTNAGPASLDLMTGTGGVLHLLLRFLSLHSCSTLDSYIIS